MAGAVLGPAMLAGALLAAAPVRARRDDDAGQPHVPVLEGRAHRQRADRPAQPGLRGGDRAERPELALQLVRRAPLGRRRTRGFIPNGELCSGGAVVYDFSGYDLARNDWPVTHLTSGGNIEFRYNKWAAHPGTFRTYITKDTWSPTRPLSWDDLESEPFYSVTDPPSVGSPGNEDAYYHWNAQLPSGKSGRHIIYTVWQRSDSNETFYGCSDVVFDGGNGEVTGVGEGDGTPTDPTTPPTDPTDPTDPPGTPGTPGKVCTAAYTSTNSWGGGYQARSRSPTPARCRSRLDGPLHLRQRRDGRQPVERHLHAVRPGRHGQQRELERLAGRRRLGHVRVHGQRPSGRRPSNRTA